MLQLAQDFGVNYTDYRIEDPVKVIPFSSSRKKMTTIIKSAEGMTLYCKGTAEMVLDRCTQVLSKEAGVIPLDEGIKAKIMKDVISVFAND